MSGIGPHFGGRKLAPDIRATSDLAIMPAPQARKIL
jgi:hypothetical protein